MRELGFEPIVAPELQSPVCVAFRSERLIPDGMAFASYYRCLRAAGLFIYSKFHADSGSFRVGCIGQIRREWVDDFLDETAQLRAGPHAARCAAGGGRGARQRVWRRGPSDDGRGSLGLGPGGPARGPGAGGTR